VFADGAAEGQPCVQVVRHPLFRKAAAFPAAGDRNELFAFAGPQTDRMPDALKDILSEMAGA
jgi:hypothetical protein